MLSLCLWITDWADDWDHLSLFVNRASILVISILALTVIRRIWKGQPSNKRHRVIPRPVLTFTAAWLISLLLVVLYVMLSPCDHVLSVGMRTLYGASLAWSLGGMTWIVVLGQKHGRTVDRHHLDAEAVRKIIDAALCDDTSLIEVGTDTYEMEA